MTDLLASGALLALGQANAPGSTATPTAHAPVLLFWVFAILAIAGAVAMVTRRNAVTAVMCLVGTIISLAALFAMLFAHFLAIIQVLVYAGAIMVLFIFVVMILNKEEEEPWALRGIVSKGLAGFALMYLFARLGSVLWSFKDRLPEAPWSQAAMESFGTTKSVGRELFTSYLFPFEAVSLVLLIAVVGALVLAHPSHQTAQVGGHDNDGRPPGHE